MTEVVWTTVKVLVVMYFVGSLLVMANFRLEYNKLKRQSEEHVALWTALERDLEVEQTKRYQTLLDAAKDAQFRACVLSLIVLGEIVGSPEKFARMVLEVHKVDLTDAERTFLVKEAMEQAETQTVKKTEDLPN